MPHMPFLITRHFLQFLYVDVFGRVYYFCGESSMDTQGLHEKAQKVEKVRNVKTGSLSCQLSDPQMSTPMDISYNGAVSINILPQE